MKRVLSLATTGVFAIGLAVAPLAARADDVKAPGHDTHATVPAASTTSPAQADRKPADKDMTAAPATGGGTTPMPVSGAKPPVKPN